MAGGVLRRLRCWLLRGLFRWLQSGGAKNGDKDGTDSVAKTGVGRKEKQKADLRRGLLRGLTRRLRRRAHDGLACRLLRGLLRRLARRLLRGLP